MRIANTPKVESLRELIDEEITRYSLLKNISRKTAYVAVARDLGFSIRAYKDSDDWACVIAITDDKPLTALKHEMAAKIECMIHPFQKETHEILSRIDKYTEQAELCVLKRDTEGVNDALHKAQALSNQVKSNLEQFTRSLPGEITTYLSAQLSERLSGSQIVFAVSVETALIASILQMLDPDCNIFLRQNEIRQYYTEQQLRHRCETLTQEIRDLEAEEISFLDGNPSRDHKVLAHSIGRLIESSLISDTDTY